MLPAATLRATPNFFFVVARRVVGGTWVGTRVGTRVGSCVGIRKPVAARCASGRRSRSNFEPGQGSLGPEPVAALAFLEGRIPGKSCFPLLFAEHFCKNPVFLPQIAARIRVF